MTVCIDKKPSNCRHATTTSVRPRSQFGQIGILTVNVVRRPLPLVVAMDVDIQILFYYYLVLVQSHVNDLSRKKAYLL